MSMREVMGNVQAYDMARVQAAIIRAVGNRQ